MKELHDLREMLCEELKEYGRKGEISTGSLAAIDTIAHAVKNIDKIIDDDGYSGRYADNYSGRYDDGMMRGSYARRRDSMGRYSRNGYSMSDFSEKLRHLMEEAPDDHTRMEIQRLIEKM